MYVYLFACGFEKGTNALLPMLSLIFGIKSKQPEMPQERLPLLIGILAILTAATYATVVLITQKAVKVTTAVATAKVTATMGARGTELDVQVKSPRNACAD